MSTSRNRNLQSAVHFALAGSALAAAAAANAQTAPSTAGAAVEEVVVTGSRIALAPNQVSISPVTQVSAADLQQSGVTRVEDMLNQLPQVFAAQGSTVSNGADGTAQVNLRNLGAQRTLVLVNGRRLGPGDPRGNSASDLNQIPTELIDSVELLTGGASSIYGADAVAGVVNFKLNDHFEGVKFVGNYGMFNHHQDNDGLGGTVLANHNAVDGTSFGAAPNNVNTGFTKDLAFIVGMNSEDGKGNATAYATYRNVAGVLQSKYDYSACTFGSGYATYDYGGVQRPGMFDCSGSSTSYPGRFQLYNGPAPFSKPQRTIVPGGPAAGYSTVTIGPNGTLVPFSNADRYNYGPINYYQRPDERWMGGVFAHYEFNEHATVYTEMQFMDDRSVSQIAASGSFFGAPIQVNCANPYLSATMLSAWCGGSTAGNTYLAIGRRNVEGPGRTDDLRHESLRMVVGGKGKINDGWTYDIYGQYASTSLSDTYQDFSRSRFASALNVVQGPNGAQCANPAAVLQGCVPWNVFQGGGVTPAAENYLSVPLLNSGVVKQFVVSANVTGDLGRYGVQLPTAKSGFKTNVGLEWRDVNSETIPDLEFQTGDGAGQGAATLPVAGGIISREGFIELNAPLIDDKPGAQTLAFDTAYRYSDYSLGFKTNTYNFGLEWAPVQDVRLRGSWARAVRAPNVGELFAPQTVALDGSIDPCATRNIPGTPGTSAATCALGNPGAGANYGNILSNSAAQYNGFVGGVPTLQPETAITKSFGIGYTPSFLPGFRAQIDWYDINITNVIATTGANTILNYCYSQNLFCNQIHRDSNGSLWLSSQGYVVDLPSNNSGLEQKGIDFDLSYRMSLGSAGKLNTQFNGTYVISAITTPIESINGVSYAQTSYDCAGYYGPNCLTPTQRWRHTMRMTWQTPWKGADLSLAWRYYGPVKLDALSPNPNIRAGAGDNASLIASGLVSNTDAYLSSRSYLDLTGSVNLSDHLNLRIGINNLLDKSPPLIGTTNLPGTFGNGNTFPQVYDSLGRYLFATITAQF